MVDESALDLWLVNAMRESRKVAKRVYTSSRGLLDSEDLVAVGYEWIAAHTEKAQEWFEDNKRGHLARSLYREMQRAVAKERAHRTGSSTADAFYYSAAVVEELLPMVWSIEDRLTSGVNDDDGQRRGKSMPSEGNTLAAALADVARAVSRLAKSDIPLLQSRFEAGLTFDELARIYGMSDESIARKRVNSLVQSIVDLLGGESPWRSRKPRSSAQGQSITSRTYDGGA